MRQPGEPGRPGTGEPVIPDSDELETLPDLLGPELPRLFDYCRALLGRDGEAARTARSVLGTAHEPLPDRDRNRAWLFAMARRQASDLRPSASGVLSYLPLALDAASSQQADNGVLRAFGTLSDGDREIVDLVYRHGIRPADLATVLAVPAEEAYRRLVDAEEELISLAAGPEGRRGADLDAIAALPFADLPEAEEEPPQEPQPRHQLDRAVLWRAIASSVQAMKREISAASTRQRRVRIAAAAVIPVVAIVWALVSIVAPGHPTASHGAAAMPRSSSGTVGLPADTPSQPQPTHSSVPGHPGYRGVPVASPVPASAPTPRLAVTVKPVPCPPGIKANLRWHYTANNSPGGWSGPAGHACPGSFTTGPQAMGNLQVTPGTTLQAGYDVSVPGNKNSLTMTVSAASVTFTVSCVSKAVPSAPTLRVLLQTRTYQITNDQWFPSGDQTSPLVYQGSVSVPALCGPGGVISLAKGGTFTATLG